MSCTRRRSGVREIPELASCKESFRYPRNHLDRIPGPVVQIKLVEDDSNSLQLGFQLLVPKRDIAVRVVQIWFGDARVLIYQFSIDFKRSDVVRVLGQRRWTNPSSLQKALGRVAHEIEWIDSHPGQTTRKCCWNRSRKGLASAEGADDR